MSRQAGSEGALPSDKLSELVNAFGFTWTIEALTCIISKSSLLKDMLLLDSLRTLTTRSESKVIVKCDTNRVTGALIVLKGKVNKIPCRQCKDGYGAMTLCVSLQLNPGRRAANGSCGNCAFKGHGSQCRHNRRAFDKDSTEHKPSTTRKHRNSRSQPRKAAASGFSSNELGVAPVNAKVVEPNKYTISLDEIPDPSTRFIERPRLDFFRKLGSIYFESSLMRDKKELIKSAQLFLKFALVHKDEKNEDQDSMDSCRMSADAHPWIIALSDEDDGNDETK